MVPDFRFRVESSGIVLSLFGIQFENMLFLDRFLVDFSRCNSGQRGLRNPDIFLGLEIVEFAFLSFLHCRNIYLMVSVYRGRNFFAEPLIRHTINTRFNDRRITCQS